MSSEFSHISIVSQFTAFSFFGDFQNLDLLFVVFEVSKDNEKIELRLNSLIFTSVVVTAPVNPRLKIKVASDLS